MAISLLLTRRKISTLGFFILTLIVAAITFLPFYWAVSLSIRNPIEAFTVSGLAVPVIQYKPTLANWKTELSVGETQKALLNSSIIGICSAAMVVVIG
ncbi:MAG: hypothetical protein AB1798_18680, partial [Spirochaetota bacterium]